MAFLYQTKFRPACVVSALPKRFRDSLARELKGAVAISSCPVSELEGTVRRRGATIAVVGVSQGTIEVAERLSHTDRGVKVFLAHYEEGSSARLNGFAGVFDLRAEAKRLAAAIKGTVSTVEPPIFPTSPFARPAPGLLVRFIELQKKVGNPAALSDGILEHLMNLGGGTEGFLLQPEKMNETTFRVTATRGENMPPIGQSIPLDPSRISSGDTFAADDLGTSAGRDHLALPMQSRGQLCAVLVCNKIDRSEPFDQFLGATSYLFDQAADREEKSLRHQLIATARSSFVDQAGWLLVDGDSRVIHREGLGGSLFKLRSNRIKEPRLQDLIYRSFHREASPSPIEIEGRRISARTIISDQGLFCLVEINLPVGGAGRNSLRGNDPFQALTLIRSSCANSGDEKTLADELIAGLVEGKDANAVLAGLEKLGVKVDFSPEEMRPALVSGLGLVLFMASKELHAPISATFRLVHGQWILTAEISEKDLRAEAFDWNSAHLFRAALEVAGFDRGGVRTAIFGFQLIGQP